MSIHKIYFVSSVAAVVGATVPLVSLDKKNFSGRVEQANPNGDLLVALAPTFKERIWVGTVEKAPTAAEHAAAVEADRKAFEERRAEAAAKKPKSEIEDLRQEVADLKAQVAALAAAAVPSAPAAPAKA